MRAPRHLGHVATGAVIALLPALAPAAVLSEGAVSGLGTANVRVSDTPGSTGQLAVEAAALAVTDAVSAALTVGSDGGSGTVVLRRDGEVKVASSGERAVVTVGDGGGGALQVDGARLDVESPFRPTLRVGAGDDGRGVLDIRNGARVTVEETLGRSDPTVIIGDGPGSIGAARVSEATLDVRGGSAPRLFVGAADGAQGVLEVRGPEGRVVLGDGHQPGLVIARGDGGAGKILGTMGRVVVTDGGEIAIGDAESLLDIGRHEGAVGLIEIRDGSRVVLNGRDNANVLVGVNFLTGPDGAPRPAGRGTIAVIGPDAELVVDPTAANEGDILLGAPRSLTTTTSDGGGLKLRDGGKVRADRVWLGVGGRLEGDGTVAANVLVDGGDLDPDGTLTFDGSLSSLRGTLHLTAGDHLHVAGNLGLSPETTLVLDLAGGAGSGDMIDLDALLSVGGEVLAFAGTGHLGSSGLALTYGFDAERGFHAVVTPLPGAVWMLGAGLGALWMARRRRG